AQPAAELPVPELVRAIVSQPWRVHVVEIPMLLGADGIHPCRGASHDFGSVLDALQRPGIGRPEVVVLDHLAGNAEQVARPTTVGSVPPMLVDRQAHPRLPVIRDVVVALLVAARPLVDEPARLPCRHAARVPGAVLDHDALTGRRKPRSPVRGRLGGQLQPDGTLAGQRCTGGPPGLGRWYVFDWASSFTLTGRWVVSGPPESPGISVV